MVPMLEQVIKRCGQAPEAWLVDGGYPGHEQIDAVAEQTPVVAPVPRPKRTEVGKCEKAPPEAVLDPHAPKPGDSPAVAAWRERRATNEACARYRDRAATAECVNAQARNPGRLQWPVRGREKAKGVALQFALAHNLMRIVNRVPEWVGIGTGMSAKSRNGGLKARNARKSLDKPKWCGI